MRQSVYQSILVLLDGRATGERGLAWARQLAHGPLSIIHLLVVEPPARSVREGSRVIVFADQMEDAVRASALAYLERVAIPLREDGHTVDQARKVQDILGEHPDTVVIQGYLHEVMDRTEPGHAVAQAFIEERPRPERRGRKVWSV